MSTATHKSDSRARARVNRRNAAKSTGPRDTSQTRFNARRHSLLSLELCELDDPTRFEVLRHKLTAELQPLGTIDTFLVHRIAFCIVRITRAVRLESEHINEKRTSDKSVDAILDRFDSCGPQASLKAETIAELADGFVRYEGAFQSMLFRCLREFKELQRERLASFGKTANSNDDALPAAHEDFATPKAE